MSSLHETNHSRAQQIVRPRVRSGPVNACGVFATGFGALAWQLWPNGYGVDLQLFFFSLAALCASSSGSAIRAVNI